MQGEFILTQQAEGDFPHAPKIFTEDCKIDWNKTAKEVHNQIRGLAPTRPHLQNLKTKN